VRWKSQNNFAARSRWNRAIEIKVNSARAYVLSFRFEFKDSTFWDSIMILPVLALLTKANHGRQAHIETPHQPPILKVGFCSGHLLIRKHLFASTSKSMQNGTRMKRERPFRPPLREVR
jgi:hypothetical protein